MAELNYNFYQSRSWFGEFFVNYNSQEWNIPGRLVYEKNQDFYLYLVGQPEYIGASKSTVFSLPEKINLGEICGFITDQEEQGLHVCLQNCYFFATAFTNEKRNPILTIPQRIHFENALFSSVGFTVENKISSIDLFFNN